MHSAQKELRSWASPQKAKVNQWFFKTNPGQYGFGDQFIGVTVPEVRKIAKKFQDINLSEIKEILNSKTHEDRLLALIILCNQFEKSRSELQQKKIVKFYIKNKAQINNWDLVDTSAYKILGRHSFQTKDYQVLKKLIQSKAHWDRRIAMVATMAFIKQGDLKLTFEFAEKVLFDKEDLMHKASGWMLREAGKKNQKELLKFIGKFGKKMPRTMLRYSIEKMSVEQRKEILERTKFS